MTLNNAMNVASAGLSAERFRMDVISVNIANANSVSVNGQDPYRRQDVVLQGGQDGPQIVGVVEDQTPFQMKPDPQHPGQQMAGTNVDPISEMTNMISASRAYEANVAAFNSAKGMIKDALSIGRA